MGGRELENIQINIWNMEQLKFILLRFDKLTTRQSFIRIFNQQ